MICLLNYYVDNSETKTPDGEIPIWLDGIDCLDNGFRVQSGNEEEVNGISMWSKPFLINRDGKQMYVILLDSQGFYSDGKGNDIDKCLFGMTTFLSSLQIFSDSNDSTDLFVDLLSSLSP